MANLFYLMTILEVMFSTIDFFFALLYAIPIIFIPRFQHRNNMFILNICITIIGSCIFFIIGFLMAYFDLQRLFAPQTCVLVLYASNIAGIAIPFSFVTFTVHRFCSIKYHTKLFFKTKRWVGICIASQWIGECIISLPFIFKQTPYCYDAFWLQVYTCMLAVFVPSLIITVLNLLIFAHVRSSSRRVQPQAGRISTVVINNIQQPIINRRDVVLIRQMIFTFFVFIIGWTPVYLTIIINYFIYIDPEIVSITAIISQLCILSIIINLFIYNRKLRQYLINKIRQCIGL